MRRDQLHKFSDVPKNMFFCAAEGGHLGTWVDATENREKGDNKKFGKVMAHYPRENWVRRPTRRGQVALLDRLQGSVPLPRTYPNSDAASPCYVLKVKRNGPAHISQSSTRRIGDRSHNTLLGF